MSGRSRPVERADASADLRILLCHFPEAVRMLPPGVFHLVLAGHYHGGQIRLPTPWGRVPLKEFHAPYLHGLYETRCRGAARLARPGNELRPAPVPRASRGDTSYASPMSEIEVSAAELSALHGGSTSAALHFRRNHFPYPDVEEGWALEVVGAVASPLRLDPEGLAGFGIVAHDVVLECAGHRRAELDPPVDGVPWGAGAVSQGRWGGASLAAVLAEAEPRPDAVEVVLVGGDGDAEDGFARAIPVAKARDEATLLAWSLDGEPIPLELGGPLRAIVPGNYAVDSVKWLRRIVVATEPFDGHFQVNEYCLVSADGIPDGTQLHELPVTSLVTVTEPGRVAGVAWGGEIARVEVQVDDGPWLEAVLGRALGPYAFVPWELLVELAPGPHTAASRATDTAGNTQPERPLWNARGYANSSVHRVTFDLD